MPSSATDHRPHSMLTGFSFFRAGYALQCAEKIAAVAMKSSIYEVCVPILIHIREYDITDSNDLRSRFTTMSANAVL